MCACEKYIRALLAKPVKWFCVLLILLISALSFAHNHKSAMPPVVKVIQPKTELPPHNQFVSGLIKKHVAALSLLLANPPDITVNVCGTSTTLTAPSIPSGYSNPTWNDGTTGSTLNVTSSGTYWWQVIGTNVVNNGNFSQGDTGFTSSYVDMTTNNPNGTQLYAEGTYAIGKNPNAYHSGFYSYGDHTTGSGNMLIVNGASGASAANVPIWSENISVAANTNYVFSVWVRSASLQSPAILQFSINGSPLGSTITPTSPAPTSAWQYFTATWNSGAVSGTNIPISLVNQNIAASGNDFAIDDIVFAPVYRQNYIINFNPIPVLSLTSPHTACGSYDLTQAINGYDSATYTYTFTNPSGTVITTAAAQAVIQSGTYTITEQNKTTGCTSAPQTTAVTIYALPVLSVTSPPAQCGTYDLKSAITNYDNTGTYTYTYKNGATTLGSSIVSASGNYTVVETNNSTNCQSTAPVAVTINPLPVLTVSSPSAQCGGTYDLKSAITNYDNTGTYTYTYKNGATTLGSSIVSASGNYTVVETNNSTNCQSTAPVAVTINPFPILTVSSPSAQCGGTYDLKNAITNYDNTGTYTYTYKNGATTLGSSIVSATGNYTVVETNNSTNCQSTAPVTVTINPLPVLTVSSPHTACGSYDLTKTISGYDPLTYTYIFQGPSPSISTITTAAAQAITQSGTYTITEQNKTTGCTSAPQQTTVTINSNPSQPGITAL